MSGQSSYILAIDQGTTGTTALIVDSSLRVVGRGYQSFEQFYPASGHVEHALNLIWQSLCAAVTQAITTAGILRTSILAIGITNQRETVACFDRQGQSLHHALVWQDRRTYDLCELLKSQGYESMIQARTGLLLDPYFSATKMAWFLRHIPDLTQKMASSKVLMGTIDTYLIYMLTGKKTYVTDPSNASRTLLFNIHKGCYDQDLCALFGIDPVWLPQVMFSNQCMGETQGLDILPDGIPILSLLGDQQSALFGQGCHERGSLKCTYGTGAFLMLNTGEKVVSSLHRLLSTIAWQWVGQKKPVYALEGSAFIAGALIQWLRDGLGIIQQVEEIESLASSVTDSQGVLCVPALTGMGAPYWRPDVRGTITGLHRGISRAHIARACLEGVAHQICDIVDAMNLDINDTIQSMRVDGGMAKNRTFLQIQSDLLGIPLTKQVHVEATAMGVAMVAGLNCGLWNQKDIEEWAHLTTEIIYPQMERTHAQAQRQAWTQQMDQLCS